MTRINPTSVHRRRAFLLRGALIAVFVVSMAGPWVYDRIMVPAQFACSAPFIRLDGDFCGTPMSGFHLITLHLGPFLEFMLHAPSAGGPSAVALLTVVAPVIALVLPAITTLLVVWARCRWQGC